MQHKHVIISKKDLLNLFSSSKKLEIADLKQMQNLLQMNIPPEVWENASNRNLLSFNQEFIKQTIQFIFNGRKIEYFHLISFLINLTQINLQNNQISDISTITKLKNLRELYLSSNNIEDISAIQSLPNLTYLDLQSNQLTSFTLNLRNLVILLLGYNNLQDHSGIKHSLKLESLNLFKTETTDLRTIPHQLFGLKQLNIGNNNITEISYLSNFVDLQNLSLSYNKQLKNIEPLKFCTQLTYLCISQTNVADIWPLQFLKNLKMLEIANTQVIDLHPLQHLYKLEQIYAYGTRIMDVSPLSNLALDSLIICFYKIINAETLKHHKNFSEYDLSGQEVPATDVIKFYNKILAVHSSYQQIKKLIAENRIPKFLDSMSHQREYINLKINQQIQFMNKKIEIIFSQNSYTDQQ
ncbi:Conserved_hypothetical protein [Hexamita inflata]|uniref:Uncharacterized protein n=1 Tax=Hexamita inflata TaxID=28002 RepID=A0AA86U190_9EUKA|nr:Conserved hypothetical protein [Hexamita inflata]